MLLKNGESADKPLLPLPKKASKILVAGSHADNLGYQCGGWTIEWQGLSGNNLTQGNSVDRSELELAAGPFSIIKVTYVTYFVQRTCRYHNSNWYKEHSGSRNQSGVQGES